MSTECSQFVFGFHPLKQREIRAQFDGGAITSDGGCLLLREVEKRVGILRQFAACFTDYRNPDLIEHKVEEMVAHKNQGKKAEKRRQLRGSVSFKSKYQIDVY
jgi:hypothetical protein